MSLKVQSRMYVLTSNGEREIQLCVGDITALPEEDKVDVILISAFPNDYLPLQTSVIGALKHNLGINVRELAMTKKEDLRRQFNCWISQTLPCHLPYRQLLCFERQMRDTVDVLDAVKEIFRAMMPIFNNENKSIITPLLATGFQNVEEVKMLGRLVKSAVEWMQMGLGLQTMKIVLYARDPDTLCADDLKCIAKFNEWKKSVESRKFLPKNPEIKYDIFLVYSDQDIDVSQKVRQKLKTLKKSVKILTATELSTKKDTWQHDIFVAMISCIRVVPLLDSAFLENSVCIDQYNIALCCNRHTHRHILAPLRLQRTTFPLYMGMVQWISCGPEDGMLEKASMILIEHISLRSVEVTLHYDVFISYSHRNLAAAKVFLETFQKLNPELKVFFDYDALKTGVSWQQTLYDSVDASRCVVALLSTDYLASAMCTEEFHLSLAKHFAKEKELELVAVSLEPVRHLVIGDYIQPVTAHGKELSDVAMATCTAICDWLKTGTKTEVFSESRDPVDIDETSEQTRELLYHKTYTLEKNQLNMLHTSHQQDTNTNTTPQVKAKEKDATGPKTQTKTNTLKEKDTTGPKTQTKTNTLKEKDTTGPKTQTKTNTLKEKDTTGPKTQTKTNTLKEKDTTGPKTQTKTNTLKEKDTTGPKTQTKTDTPKSDTRRKTSLSQGGVTAKKETPKPESQRRGSSVKAVSSTMKVIQKLETPAKKSAPKQETLAKRRSSLKKEPPTKKAAAKQESERKMETPKENLQTKKVIPKQEMEKQETEKKETNGNGQTSTKEEIHVVDSVVPDSLMQVYLSFTLSDQKYASLLEKMLRKKMPAITMNTLSGGDEAEQIEAARCIVVFLSSKYLCSRKQMEEFNLILSKQRSSHGRRLMYVLWLNYIPPKPTYIHLVPTDTVLTDVLWDTLVGRLREGGGVDGVFAGVAAEKAAVEKEFVRLKDSDVMALLKVTCDISAMVTSGRPQHNLSIENVVLTNVIQLHKDLARLETDRKQPAQKTTAKK